MMFGLSLLIPTVGIWMWMIAKRRHLQQAPPCSIVLLLRGARAVDAEQLAEWLTEETGRPIRARQMDANRIPKGEQPANDTVTGVAPHFVAVVGGTYFMVHNP